MATIILGHSRCKICGRILLQGEEVVGLPAFVANKLDPLTEFSDSAFHLDCFNGNPLRNSVNQRLTERDTKTGPGNRVCEICGRTINTLLDHFMLPFLIDREDHPAFPYNYFQAHRGCLENWGALSELHRVLTDLRGSTLWVGAVLDPAIEELNRVVRK